MSVLRVGDVVTGAMDADGTGSAAVVVPSGAQIAVVVCSLWREADNWFPANPFTLSAVALTTVQKTDEQHGGGQVWLGYVLHPVSGTLAWNWGVAVTQRGGYCVGFFRGIDTASPIRASGQQLTTGADLTGLSATPRDMMVGGMYSYAAVTITDSAQVALYNGSLDGEIYLGAAQKQGGTGFFFTGGAATTVAALVLAAGVVKRNYDEAMMLTGDNFKVIQR